MLEAGILPSFNFNNVMLVLILLSISSSYLLSKFLDINDKEAIKFKKLYLKQLTKNEK